MNTKRILWAAGAVLVSALFLAPFFSDAFAAWAARLFADYPGAAPVIVILVRFAGSVIAPLPSIPIAFSSLLFMPWWVAWLANTAGSSAGALAAFWIARRFREPAVRNFAPLKEIHRWEERLGETKEFWAFAGLRFLAVFAFDYVSYAAGLAKISWRHFTVATILIDLVTNAAFFYAGGAALRYGFYVFAAFALLFAAAALFFILKDRARQDGDQN